MKKDLLGAHQSTSMGFDKAVSSKNCSSIQIFTGNTSSWRDRNITAEDIVKFKNARADKFVVSHSIYLINMATSDLVNREKSKTALLQEIDRCSRLGIKYFVVHPGSNPDTKKGITLVSEMIMEITDILKRSGVSLLLETTAGQGSSLGRSFEELKAIYQKSKSKQVFFCMDTCHIFAAGYDIVNDYEGVMNHFDKVIGIENLKLMHLNDSMGDLGQHKDRHAHIGMGKIGKSTFSKIINDSRLKDIPKILETPKDDGYDDINLKLLRSFKK